MGELWLKRGVLENSLSCGVDNKLKAMKLTARKIEKVRVTVVDLGMNERRGEGLGSGRVESVPELTKVTNGLKA